MCKIEIPLGVNRKYKGEYYNNFRLATKKSGNLMLFAADQKIEHLNDDFVGPTVHTDDSQPEHLFRIAEQAKVGVMAAHLGLLSKYGYFYRSLPYLVKLNAKTNLVSTKQHEPNSKALHTVEQVIEFAKNSHLKIVGIGYTIYLGSEYEADMLTEATQAIYQAQQHGLLSVLWIYPRGQAVSHENNPHLTAGAVGVAACLGADFVKVSYPHKATKLDIKNIIKAAGKTGVIFSGGSSQDPKDFLKNLRQQIDLGARGNATGRNIHQRSLPNAIRMAKAVSAISLYNYSHQDAYDIYLGKKKFDK